VVGADSSFPVAKQRPDRGLVLAWAFLLLSLGFLFFYQLGVRDLWSSHEGRAGQNAQGMLRTGRWGLPRLFDEQRDLQKPPLYYWLVAAAARCRGADVDAWAVRLPSALAALLGAIAVGAFLTWRGRPIAGLFAALVLGTAIHYTWLARVGRIDMPLSLAVSLAIYGFYLAAGERRKAESGTGADDMSGYPFPFPLTALAAGYVAVAIALMLKGPIGALLPAVVIALHLLVERRTVSWRRSSLGWGVPLVLLLALPWYAWAYRHTDGEFFRVFFWRHNVERGLAAEDDGAMHARPWWFYLAHLFGDLLPWSLLLPFAVWQLTRHRQWRQDPEARFGLVWLLGIALLLSCFRFKRSDYLLPAYPGAALLLGCTAERWCLAGARPRHGAAAFALVLLASLAGWWGYLNFVLPRQENQREQQRFAAEIRARVPPPQGVLFFRVEAHHLAFHLGPPLNTFLEWENLDVWASRPGFHYILMTPEAAAAWQAHVKSGRLVEVLRNTDLSGGTHEKPLVLMRTNAGRW